MFPKRAAHLLCRKGMTILDQIKARIKAALARFAKRKAQQQAEGMEQEARGIVESIKDLAQRNPLGLALLGFLGVGLLLLTFRSKREADPV